MTKEAGQELAVQLRDFQNEKPIVRESRDKLLALRGQVEMLVLQIDEARSRLANAEYQHSLSCRPLGSAELVISCRTNLKALCDAIEQQLLALEEGVDKFDDLTVAMEATIPALALIGGDISNHTRRISQLRVLLVGWKMLATRK